MAARRLRSTDAALTIDGRGPDAHGGRVRALLDLLLPVACAACGAPGTAACPPCAATLDGPARLVWPRPTPVGMPPPFAVAAYAGAPRAFLLAYKEQGRVGLHRPLGAALARAVAVAIDTAIDAATSGPVS